MHATLSQNSFLISQLSPVEREYQHSRHHYQQQRQSTALKLRRQLVRRRSRFQRRLDQALSPSLRAELDIQIVLDAHFLQRPGFVGIFEDNGIQWVVSFQAHLFGGRWYFRSTRSAKLYACSPKHLETQLCYALGQYRLESSDLAYA